MATLTSNELLAAIRRLPIGERLRLIEQAARDAQDDTPSPPASASVGPQSLLGSDIREANGVATGASASVGPQSLLGLFSDEPELADEVRRLAYKSRESARMRTPE